MNKEQLRDLADKLKSLSDSIQELSESIDGSDPEEPEKVEKKTEDKPKVAKSEKQVSLEEVRAVLAEKSHAGLTAEVRGLLEKYGAEKLSLVDPANYAALLKDAEGLK